MMLVSVIPASVIGVLADYEDGMDCWHCDHYHWDEYCCGATEECAFGFDHCEECCVICEQCEECLYEDGIELCDDCGLCVFCCQDNAEAQGCSCREYCVENPDWYDHLCSDCGNAFCEVDVCDACGLCLDCCEGNSDCSETPPVCVEDDDYEFHFCEDCGDCFHGSVVCEDCEAAGALLCENCCKLRLEEEGCASVMPAAAGVAAALLLALPLVHRKKED